MVLVRDNPRFTPGELAYQYEVCGVRTDCSIFLIKSGSIGCLLRIANVETPDSERCCYPCQIGLSKPESLSGNPQALRLSLRLSGAECGSVLRATPCHSVPSKYAWEEILDTVEVVMTREMGCRVVDNPTFNPHERFWR